MLVLELAAIKWTTLRPWPVWVPSVSVMYIAVPAHWFHCSANPLRWAQGVRIGGCRHRGLDDHDRSPLAGFAIGQHLIDRRNRFHRSVTAPLGTHADAHTTAGLHPGGSVCQLGSRGPHGDPCRPGDRGNHVADYHSGQ